MKIGAFIRGDLQKTLILILLGGLLVSCQSSKKKSPVAHNGQIDFSSWDFTQNGVAKLNGEWKFYWGSLPTHSNELDTLEHAGTCLLPRFWTEVAGEDTYFEKFGVGTYHLAITLPDTLSDYSLKLNAVFSSYALWENGNLLTTVGKVGLTPETTVHDFETRLVELPRRKKIDLFLQVASWEYVKGGGAIEAISIGKSEQIQQLWHENFTAQLFAFAIVSGISLYLIVLAFFYPEDRSYLYVGLFALLGALRAICMDELVIENLIDDLTYFGNQRLRYASYFCGSGFIVLAVNELFKGYLSKYVIYGTYILFVHGLLAFVLPFQWTAGFSYFFQLIAVMLMLSCLYPIFQTMRDKKNRVEAQLFMVGGGALVVNMLYTLLYFNGLTQVELYGGLGNVTFIFCLILILANRNRSTYEKASQLSMKLSNLNKNLTLEVEHRTEEINSQKDQIEEQANELSVANEKLKELDEVKNRFFANISHELRTPLTLILGGISKVKKEVTNKGVDLIEKQAGLLHQLINQLLDLIKLEAGKMESNKSTQPVIKLLERCFYSFESLAALKKISMEFHTDMDELEMLIDPKAIERIVYNLLSNAYKFTPESGKIALHVHVVDQHLELIIKDTGVGISEKELPFIFDRFYQVDSSMQKTYQGTGIGLALVKELVTLQDGTIEVKSKEGEGTTFVLKLPIDKDERQIQAADVESYLPEQEMHVPEIKTVPEGNIDEVDKKATTPIVLIVEDHPSLQELISEEFQEDYQVLKAKDGQEGWEMAIEHIPDIIISDVMMPRKNGYELCELLKKDERTSHIPIVLLTARVAQENKIEGLLAGADDYLGKPFDTQELRIRVQNLIHTRRMLQSKYAQNEVLLIEQASELLDNPIDKGFMNKLKEEIEGNYSDELYGVEQMAESLNMSRRQLYRKLKAIGDITPSKFLQTFRLQKAKALLANQTLQVKEVGYMVGFASPSYFNKCFKDQWGVTPKEFQGKV